MTVRGQQARRARRTLRELLPITAVAIAAALAVAVVVTPAMSYLDRSLSGLVDDIPDAVTAPVARGARLLSPGDITVRVPPRTAARPVALAEPEASPLELVTGELGAALVGQDAGGRDIAGAAALRVPEVAAPVPTSLPAPPVPSELAPLVPLLPPVVDPVVEAVPEEVDDDLSSGVTKRESPSRQVREPRSGTEREGSADSVATFSIAGIKGAKDSHKGDSRSGSASSGSTGANDQKDAQKHGQKHEEKHPDSSAGTGNDHSPSDDAGDDEPKTRNSKPEKR